MIRGLGLDVVDLSKFREQLADPASSFVAATFTATERREAALRPGGDPAPHLAGRYAAKEAFLKAWSGPRFGQRPYIKQASLQDIEVVSDTWGRPSLRLHGAVSAAYEQDGGGELWLSLSHDGNVVAAVVVVGEQPRASA